MARTHRKLFPAGTTINQTQDCAGFCDPACPYNCYPFPEDYYSPPPPPILASDHSSPGNHISSYLIILASLFTAIFVVVGFYVIKVKCYNDWCGWRVNGPVPSQSDNSEDEFLNENQVDHPVWFITTIGLQQSIINSITVCKYRKDEGLIEGTECSVCLNEFREDETLRLLPKCNHAFHIPCIDTWLRSHTNCPLCRAGIVSNNANPEAAVSNLASAEQNSANLGRNQETQMENTRNDVELSNNDVLVIANGASENSAGTGEASEAIEVNDESNSKERVNVDRHQVTQVLNVPNPNNLVPDDETQTEIRSVNVSIDSSSKLVCGGGSCPGPGMANSCSTEPESHPVDHIQDETESYDLLNKDGDCSAMCKTMSRSSIADCLHVSPVTMKRSFSCSERILSTRGYRNLNSTLPY